MIAFGLTDRGKVRSANQDAFRILELPEKDVVLAVLCDGMGGVHGGEIASSLAAESFLHYTEKILREESEPDPAQILREAAAYANLRVYDRAFRDDSYRGMGTTLVAALLKQNEAAVINIGDSRCYLLSDSSIQQITRDHSLVQSMVDRGLITASEAQTHPQKNVIMRAVGLERSIRSDIYRLDMKKNDTLLLCSDGLSNQVSAAEMCSALNDEQDKFKACQKLLQLALDRGAPDNVTIALVHC